MSDNIQRVQELLAQEGLESIAQKLYNTIYNELPGQQNAPRRWIWELLQNAKDVISHNGIIEVNLTEDSLEFAHNGAPFLQENLLALLSQNSTKKHKHSDDEKQEFFNNLFYSKNITEPEAAKFLSVSGKFGTGFMTTYLMSKNVSLTGVYDSNGLHRYFDLSFDRLVEKDTEMKVKVKNSFSKFTELYRGDSFSETIDQYVFGKTCDTRFTYKFDDKGRRVAEQGILDLYNSIPFVLAFVDKLNTIKVNELGKETIYTHQSVKKDGKLSIERILKQVNGEESTFEIAKLSEHYNSLAIAIPIEKLENSRYKVVFPNEATPRQFISFPLVGSESFPFPVIVNSPLFNPNPSRSHIHLKLINEQGFDKKVRLNRSLFEKAVNLFRELLKYGSESEWEDLHVLAKSDLPTNLSDEWYKDNIQQEIRKEILNSKIVITESGDRIDPKSAMFPIFRKNKLDEFWEICKHINKTNLPRKQDVDVWKSIVEVNSKNWQGVDFDLTLEKLLKQVESKKTFSAFNDDYFQNEMNAFNVLNDIIRFTEEEKSELLNRKEDAIAVFPNQDESSPFSVKRELSLDRNVPKQIKDILRTIGKDWNKKLLRKEITEFDRDVIFTTKKASDIIRETVEKYLSDSLVDSESQNLVSGLFELSGYYTIGEKEELSQIFEFLKLYFPDRVDETFSEISEIDEFDWDPYKNWATRTIFKKVSEFESMDGLCKYLFNLKYPPSNPQSELRYKVDMALNDLIKFGLEYNKPLLQEFSIIPNQLDKFCLYGSKLFFDDKIPPELKVIIADFGKDCRGTLLHKGVSVTLPNEPRDIKWICGELDSISIKEKDNSDFKQPIRELDKWIRKNKNTFVGVSMSELFKSFHRQRSGIVLNTYDITERDKVDEIINSGMISDLSDIVKSGASATTIKNITNILQINPNVTSENLGQIISIAETLKRYPDLTPEKLEQLFELEELSKGWDPQIQYSPSEEQRRKNFENGWKGEAFVYKELRAKNFTVEWRNKSNTPNKNRIIDFEGEEHYIFDRGDKFDLIAKNVNGEIIFVQVKSTTTDISQADQIALPISSREWNFVFETKETDAYYLARVFNVSSSPVVYYMKLEKPEEL